MFVIKWYIYDPFQDLHIQYEPAGLGQVPQTERESCAVLMDMLLSVIKGNF